MHIRVFGFFICLWLIGYNCMANNHGDHFDSADPNYQITFPRDHGAHKNFRIEWWYLTANLKSRSLGDLGHTMDTVQK